jgi:hypothetical protein
MKPPTRSEHDEQVALFKMIRLYSIKHPPLKNAFAIPNGGQRHKAVAAKLKAEGVSPRLSGHCLRLAVQRLPRPSYRAQKGQ